MLSTLSSIADRNFILGFLLPIVLSTIGVGWAFQDTTMIGGVWALLVDADSFGKLTVLLVGIWTLALLLSIFNINLYKILEGYWGPLARGDWTNQAKTERRSCEEKLVALARAAQKAGPDTPANRAYYDAKRELSGTFPGEDDVLPTRFGNVVSAFESYAVDMYGVDSVPVWTRLNAVIPSSYQATINGARAEVDFFVNGCFLALVVALMTGVGAISDFVLTSPASGELGIAVVRRLSLCALAFALIFLCYEAAIDRARAWGATVCSAFDLYLPDLAKQLGYTLPADAKTRSEFWNKISNRVTDRIALEPADWLSPPHDDSDAGRATRARLLERLNDRATLGALIRRSISRR